MRTIVIVLAALVLLAAAAIALAPASLVVPTVSHLTSNRVVLADVEGSVWKGRATLVADDGGRVPFAWTTEPAALARGELRLHLAPRGAGTTPRGDIALNDGALRARDVSFAVPAAWLARVVAKTLPFGVTGDVDIAIGSLDWSAQSSRGDARVEWRNARLAAPGSRPLDLGNVTVQLAADGNQLAGPIANDGGELAITGDIAALANGGGEANLLLTPRRADDALARMLAAVGTPEGSGYRMRARWPAR